MDINITSSYIGKYVRVTKLKSFNDLSREHPHIPKHQ